MRLLLMYLTVLLSSAGLGSAQRVPPAGAVLSGVPLVVQSYNACGPASVAQVLAYYGIRKSLAEVSVQTRVNDRAYMTAQAIVNYAPQVGMQARLFTGGTVNTARRLLAGSVPVIALQTHITADGRQIPHWRVLVGFDDARRLMYLMDPLLGYVLMSYEDVTRVWGMQRGQFALLYPPTWQQHVQKLL